MTAPVKRLLSAEETAEYLGKVVEIQRTSSSGLCTL
jgi:hypothetical protein